MFSFTRAALTSSQFFRRRGAFLPSVRVVRTFKVCHPLFLEIPNFTGLMSNMESEKADKVTKEVSKKQVLDEDDEEDMEEMFIMGPSQGMIEWGGPTRGGVRPEPTRYGDWERKGRVTDF